MQSNDGLTGRSQIERGDQILASRILRSDLNHALKLRRSTIEIDHDFGLLAFQEQ